MTSRNQDDDRDAMKRVRAVARVLRDAWDPIGRGQMPDLPADEYVDFAPAVVSLLSRDASDAEIAAHLRKLETDIVGAPERSLGELAAIVPLLRTAT